MNLELTSLFQVEQERLGKDGYSSLWIRADVHVDLQHHLFLLTLDGKLNLAPISNPQYVLDIGTGTGIWAIEYGETQIPKTRPVAANIS